MSAEQGWTDTQSTTMSKTITDTYTGKLPARSQRMIELLSTATQSDISYTADLMVSFTVQFEGFLRWGGNARNTHPTDRPFVTSAFGSSDGKISAQEDIADQWNHKNIPHYSDWDWEWMQQKFGPRLDAVTQQIIKDRVTVDISGKFSDVKGLRCEIRAKNPEPIQMRAMAHAGNDDKRPVMRSDATQGAWHKDSPMPRRHWIP